MPRVEFINGCDRQFLDAQTHLKLITSNIKHALCIIFTSYPRAFSDSLGAHSAHGQAQPASIGELPSLPASTNQREKGQMSTLASCFPADNPEKHPVCFSEIDQRKALASFFQSHLSAGKEGRTSEERHGR